MDDLKYVEMCRTAIEIQKNHKWENYDLYWCTEIADTFKKLEKQSGYKFNSKMALGIYLDSVITCDSCNEEIDLYPFDKYFSSNEVIWLPIQGQLQKMIKISSPLYLELSFHNSLNGPFCFIEYYKQFISMEQLWLAFVMKENYNKIWNEKEQDWEGIKNENK